MTNFLQEGSEAAQLKVKKPAVVKTGDDDEVALRLDINCRQHLHNWLVDELATQAAEIVKNVFTNLFSVFQLV